MTTIKLVSYDLIDIQKIDKCDQNAEWEGEVWLLPESKKKEREKFGFRQNQRLKEKKNHRFLFIRVVRGARLSALRRESPTVAHSATPSGQVASTSVRRA